MTISIMYFVYFLKSKIDQGYYIGVTSNLEKRIHEHNTGLSKSTKSRRPFETVRIEKFMDKELAYRREKFLKSRKSKKIIKKIIGY